MNKNDLEICTHSFEDNTKYEGAVVPPIYQTSLYTFKDFKEFSIAMENQRENLVYSRGVNPTVRLLENKLAALEKGEMCKAFGAGMGAISATMMTLLQSGDHVLLVNQTYGPTVELLQLLQSFGVEFDQTSNNLLDIEKAILENTKLIYIESPSSMSMDVADLVEISKLAKEHGILTAIDNTWATPLFQKPLTLGIDLVIHSLSKYISGHSDVVAGAVIGRRELIDPIFQYGHQLFGSTLAPQDAFLILRGLRTLPLRMKQHQENVLNVIDYLKTQEEVTEIHHPSVLTGNMRAVSDKQLSGYSGLLSFNIKHGDFQHIEAFMNALTIIQIGVSWGGYESLAISPIKHHETGICKSGFIRLAVGLEGSDLIIEDLCRGFEALQNVSEK
ncbi:MULTISPECIES: PLP-dependent aspartate aminotransferase family protein [unclassified Sporosarcina]|uniref:trans-sulfuration enzyme family protein n=1 Tax=unclassified Sporosarcina TaxID=2647733 RepID=UPI0020406905|nr:MULTISPECIES: PLP-dependent aspartate aminotransferase family protein [unclassified Sporosarcina]GKV65934.1 cystathionine gamma-synthase [Sporosarcina sp. NCCP-2331]GLB56066.1 cystathionine gamma-synthase [Sporosarcina sp. NCCP-2378]